MAVRVFLYSFLDIGECIIQVEKEMGEMKEQNKKLTIAEPIAERLRNGEKVICAKCKKGYYVTDAKDISTSHGFYCNRCNSMANIDPVIDIE